MKVRVWTQKDILGAKPVADATLREALTAQALQGILANPTIIPELEAARVIAVDAVAYADAVLEILTAEASEGEEIP